MDYYCNHCGTEVHSVSSRNLKCPKCSGTKFITILSLYKTKKYLLNKSQLNEIRDKKVELDYNKTQFLANQISKNVMRSRLKDVRTVLNSSRQSIQETTDDSKVNASSRDKSNTPQKQKSYYQALIQTVSSSDLLAPTVQHLPTYYLILSNILSNPKSDWYSKMLVTYALSYLVVDNDIISDSTTTGSVDDTFICAYVLKKIRDEVSKNIILMNLKDIEIPENTDIFSMISDSYQRSNSFLEEKADDVLELTGIKDFESLNLNAREDMSHGARLRKNKIKLLYAMIAVKANKILQDSEGQEVAREAIKRNPELIEIKRFISYI